MSRGDIIHGLEGSSPDLASMFDPPRGCVVTRVEGKHVVSSKGERDVWWISCETVDHRWRAVKFESDDKALIE